MIKLFLVRNLVPRMLRIGYSGWTKYLHVSLIVTYV